MNEKFLAAADELRQQIGAKVDAVKAEPAMAEILRLQQSLNTLEDLAEQPKTTLAQLFNLDAGGAAAAASPLAIRPDEFYGLDSLDAAKKYLKKRGAARPFKEIVDAIRRGGCKVGDERELQVRMGRSTYEVAVLPDDHYGLVEFYPHLKRGRGKKRAPVAADGGADQAVLGDDGGEKDDAPPEGEASEESQ